MGTKIEADNHPVPWGVMIGQSQRFETVLHEDPAFDCPPLSKRRAQGMDALDRSGNPEHIAIIPQRLLAIDQCELCLLAPGFRDIVGEGCTLSSIAAEVELRIDPQCQSGAERDEQGPNAASAEPS